MNKDLEPRAPRPSAIAGEDLRRLNSYERSVRYGTAYNSAYAALHEKRPAGVSFDINSFETNVIGTILYFRRRGITQPLYTVDLAEFEDGSHLRVTVTRRNHDGFSYNFSMVREGRAQEHQDILDGTLKSYRNNGKQKQLIPVSHPPTTGK
jgi:hypothetical protein